MTIDLLRARCLGDMAKAVDLLEERYRAYPQSMSARAQYAWALQRSNQPRAARAMLRRMDPEHDIGWEESVGDVWPRYWWYMAASEHMLGEYRSELAITARWRDSASRVWQVVRGRALGALGREREVIELFGSMAGASVDTVAERQLRIATELWSTGIAGLQPRLAESVLVEARNRRRTSPNGQGPSPGRTDCSVGRSASGRRSSWSCGVQPTRSRSWRRRPGSPCCSPTRLPPSGSTASSPEESNVPLRSPWVRGAQILARAHIAAGLGRRERAVALLQEARARGMLDLGSSHAFHEDLLLAPLRGYPPFDALLIPDN